MSRLKTILCTLTLCSFGLPAPAFNGSQSELTAYFARCTGQLSAMMEFQWLIGDMGADETERARADMIDLLQAIMIDSQGREVLAQRINAKAAFSALLHRSYFNQDADDIAWAQTRISREIANCQGLLLT